MKKAIDNYAVGKQIEVTAWKGQSISANRRRFFCPECMESVALDKRGHFRHKNRTEQSIECEKRVDSPSRTPYERMGLPLFLKEDSQDIFHIYLGFPSLSDQEISSASSVGAALAIGDGKSNRINLKISRERFFSNGITHVPLSFLPQKSSRYTVEYSATPNTIINKWTHYSDIWGNTQFFKCTDGYSRKVRQLGTIVVNQYYYYIGDTWGFNPYRKVVEVTPAGQLSLGKTTLKVHRLCVRFSQKTQGEFSAFSNYLLEKHHLNLLMGESEVSPLWPPCAMDDNYFIFPNETSYAYFVVKSPNPSPVVYKYTGAEYCEVPLKNTAPPLLDVLVTKADTPLSVDKAFNGNIQFLRKQPLSVNCLEENVDIEDDHGMSILDQKIIKVRNRSFCVKCSHSCNVFHIRSTGAKSLYHLKDEQGIIINSINWNDSIIVLTHAGRQILFYTFEHAATTDSTEEHVFINKMRCANGPVEPINARALAVLKKSIQYPLIYQEIQKYFRVGYIPTQALSLLIERFGGK